MASRLLVVSALAVLLVASGAPGGVQAAPSCTGTSCDVGGTYFNATVNINITWNSLRGNITIMMYEEGAPITTTNFEKLTATNFYDGCKFHRCIDNFVAQTGDPNSKDNNPYNDGYGGSSQTIPLEINETLTHIDGAVGMARGQDPNSASSQFYICDGPQHGLDGNYSVFGVVVDGLDLAKQIAAAPTYGNKRPLLKDHPKDDIIMTSLNLSPGFWVNTTNTSATLVAGRSVLLQNIIGVLGAGGIAVAVGAAAYWFVRVRRRERARAGT
jgi:peptidyl-prolyl cis-trans isomerase B (cyclophilin B)